MDDKTCTCEAAKGGYCTHLLTCPARPPAKPVGHQAGSTTTSRFD